jgi:CBS domain-containing protein
MTMAQERNARLSFFLSNQSIRAIAIKVLDVMSHKLVTVCETETVSAVAEMLLNRAVGSVIVSSLDGREALGIITKGDILRQTSSRKDFDPNKSVAKNIMTWPVVTIGADATLEDASKMMIQKKISKLPVIKDNHLVGIVTSTNIIRAQPIEVGYLEKLIRARFVPRVMRY